MIFPVFLTMIVTAMAWTMCMQIAIQCQDIKLNRLQRLGIVSSMLIFYGIVARGMCHFWEAIYNHM